MIVEEYQADLRRAYINGGPGAIISGIVWLAAGMTAKLNTDIATGFYVLFFGGMLIFPISKLVLNLFFKRAPESRSNPGGIIVIETVVPMIGGLFAAWLLLPHRPDFVFSIAAIAVGAHYFGFRTAYGDWTYWIFGGVLCATGAVSIIMTWPEPIQVPFIVAAIEIVFGVWFILRDRKTSSVGSGVGMN